MPGGWAREDREEQGEEAGGVLALSLTNSLMVEATCLLNTSALCAQDSAADSLA